VQQIAIMMGCAVLPYLRNLVNCIAHGLADEQQEVRTMTALGFSPLAEAAAPYSIQSFDEVLKPLWLGIRQHRGKGLAAFFQSYQFHHSAYGSRICILLHEGSHRYSDS
jgi:splicing factor 3B subunit 1